MPNNERRGKWQPFDALEGYKNSLNNVEKEKDKIEKPIIYPDQLEEMNEALVSCFDENKEVIVSFYKSGYIYEISGLITNIDNNNHQITINKNKIKLLSITNIKRL